LNVFLSSSSWVVADRTATQLLCRIPLFISLRN
jgi:hypothetical protein